MRAALFVLALACCAPTLAAPPSDASLRELMELSNARKLYDGAIGQMDSMMQASMQGALQGKTITPEVQATVDRMRAKMVALMTAEMGWDTMEPMTMDVYRQSLTQSEVDGMVTFYKSEAGRAVIAKMPLIMQNTMQAMQQKLRAIMPKIQQLAEESAAEIKQQQGK